MEGKIYWEKRVKRVESLRLFNCTSTGHNAYVKETQPRPVVGIIPNGKGHKLASTLNTAPSRRFVEGKGDSLV